MGSVQALLEYTFRPAEDAEGEILMLEPEPFELDIELEEPVDAELEEAVDAELEEAVELDIELEEPVDAELEEPVDAELESLVTVGEPLSV